MNIIFDQGNTRTKIAWFDRGNKIESLTLINPVNDVQALLKKHKVSNGMVSSVVGSDLFDEIKALANFPVLSLSHSMRLPFSMNYSTPKTLGLDRIALAAAAVAEYPGQNCLVIDAGTCITYDFVNAEGVYHGGAISLGVQMRFKAMNRFTAGLPISSVEEYNDLIGDSTLSSLASGVIIGVKEEVRGTIQLYAERFAPLITVITGGDASMFDHLVKNSIFAAPEFLLQGLNNILEYHAEMR